jgi:hypothetical protein
MNPPYDSGIWSDLVPRYVAISLLPQLDPEDARDGHAADA